VLLFQFYLAIRRLRDGWFASDCWARHRAHPGLPEGHSQARHFPFGL